VIDVWDLALKKFYIVDHVLAALLGFLLYHWLTFEALLLCERFHLFEPALPVIFFFHIAFLLPHDQDVWEVHFVLEVLLVKVDLPLVDKLSLLAVVMGSGVVCDLLVGVTDDGDDEVHQDHEKTENTHQEQQVREHHDR